MRMADLDPRQAAVAAVVCATLRRSRSARLWAIAACGFALAGCETLVPLPEAALLKPQPSPKCEARAEKGAGDGSAEAGKLRRLDYEVQCYRHAEMIARARLGKLQASIGQAKAKALASKCEARSEKAAGDGSSEAAKLRRLDYEAQCYRHAEMIARARLSKLQATLQQQAKAKPKETASTSDTAYIPQP